MTTTAQRAALAELEGKPWAASFCCLQGLLARRMKRGVRDNPYPKRSPAARCWRHGYDTEIRRCRRIASREAISRPGRGGSVKGRRGEWSMEDLALLSFGAGDLSHATIGEIVGRSCQAVSNRVHRLETG